MRFILPALSFLFLQISVLAQWPVSAFEKSHGRETASYQDLIRFYEQLDRLSPKVKLVTKGITDAGYPLHLALFSNDGQFDPAQWHKSGKAVILVNNGIHPGEPDGVDASMQLLRDLCQGKLSIPDQLALAFIPVYNIGGMLNRSSNYRVDQNGPEAFGSRGNSQNLDLNRDFIKADSKEALSFSSLYRWLNPDVFIDNHVSNGADYQHIMTLISSQHNKLGGKMGEFMNTRFEPALNTLMKEKGYDLIPYVNDFEETPDSGWPEFFESPRYSSGYASLWSSFAFIPETHMLKPYPQRVQATYALMQCFFSFTAQNSREIKALRAATVMENLVAEKFPLQWELDRSKFSERRFKGYEAGKKASAVSGLPRLYYDRNKPFEKNIRFYNEYTVSKQVTKPKAYIIPQGWWKVVERLKANGVQMKPLPSDTLIEVEAYDVLDYKTSPKSFESHHPNTAVTLNRKMLKKQFRKGDWLIMMNQEANRFTIETLEPESVDSYFAWNFFDAILNRKEGYSDYVFEDRAAQYLDENPGVKSLLVQKAAADSVFAKSAGKQLDFVYEHSPWYEPGYRQYPVYRLLP